MTTPNAAENRGTLCVDDESRGGAARLRVRPQRDGVDARPRRRARPRLRPNR